MPQLQCYPQRREEMRKTPPRSVLPHLWDTHIRMAGLSHLSCFPQQRQRLRNTLHSERSLSIMDKRERRRAHPVPKIHSFPLSGVMWDYSSPLNTPRQHNASCTGQYVISDMFDLYGNYLYPRSTVTPVLRRNGFNTRFLLDSWLNPPRYAKPCSPLRNWNASQRRNQSSSHG